MDNDKLKKVQDNYDPGFCIPNCPICHGYGWIRKDVEIHHPEFGKLERCPNAVYSRWDNDLGITISEAMMLNWDKFIKTEAVMQMKNAYGVVLERGYGWLYIYGEPGNGKTIMAKAVSVYARHKYGKKVRYRKLSDVMNDLRTSYDDNFGQIVYKNKLFDWSNVEMLVLDEIGRDRQTDFGKQSLSDIMDARYEKAISGKSITVWVGNFAPEEILEQYQIDRIRDGRFQVVNIKGKSVRPAMNNQEITGEEWWNK